MHSHYYGLLANAGLGVEYPEPDKPKHGPLIAILMHRVA